MRSRFLAAAFSLVVVSSVVAALVPPIQAAEPATKSSVPAVPAISPQKGAAAPAEPEPTPPPGANIVTLDKFRKK